MQTQGAGRIHQGAHAYNAKQSASEDDPVFCFVQNISVNGFGDSLGYNQGGLLRFLGGYDNAITQESTLMTEMAMLHTLGDEIPGQPQVMALYTKYLESAPRAAYFSQSPQGVEAISAISAIKKSFKNKDLVIDPDPVMQAKAALLSLMANNLHFKPEYGKLVQALSIFVEDASIAGCKSGNERAQGVNGRVAVFDTWLNQPTKLGNQQDSFTNALAAVAAGGKGMAAKAQTLKTLVDSIYNKSGLQAGVAVVSEADQGATAKGEAKKGMRAAVDTNYFEESATVMTNLKQSKASNMQAHKGAAASMAGAWSGADTRSVWERMSGKGGGVGGAVRTLCVQRRLDVSAGDKPARLIIRRR